MLCDCYERMWALPEQDGHTQRHTRVSRVQPQHGSPLGHVMGLTIVLGAMVMVWQLWV